MSATSNHPDTRPDSMPLARVARERLRDKQQEETRRLAAVLTAQERLAAERSRAAAVIAKAERAVAVRQDVADAAVVELIEVSGLAKAAVLLDRSEKELARLHRTRKRGENTGNGSRNRDPVVPA